VLTEVRTVTSSKTLFGGDLRAVADLLAETAHRLGGKDVKEVLDFYLALTYLFLTDSSSHQNGPQNYFTLLAILLLFDLISFVVYREYLIRCSRALRLNISACAGF
jgi:hypothetical protein